MSASVNCESKRTRKPPLYLHVKELIRERIGSADIATGYKLETENDLARKYGVSRPTIRQALSELEKEGYINRVHGRGTYVAERKAIAHTDREIRTVHMIVPRLTDSFIGQIVTGAQEVLLQSGYGTSILVTNDQIENEQKYIRELMSTEAAALLIHPTKSPHYNPAMFELKEKNIPFVMTGRHYRYLECSYIEADNYQGAYDAVSYLIDLGHRYIGLVSKPPMIETSLEDRIHGYLDALADHGLPLSRKMLFTTLEDTRNVYYQARDEAQEKHVLDQLIAYLKDCPEMTATIALNDLIAADIIRAAKLCGKTIGPDLSVIGFDNVSLSACLDPPLTTVDCPTLEIGREAAETLIDQIQNSDATHNKRYLSMELIIRKSCSNAR